MKTRRPSVPGTADRSGPCGRATRSDRDPRIEWRKRRRRRRPVRARSASGPSRVRSRLLHSHLRQLLPPDTPRAETRQFQQAGGFKPTELSVVGAERLRPSQGLQGICGRAAAGAGSLRGAFSPPSGDGSPSSSGGRRPRRSRPSAGSCSSLNLVLFLPLQPSPAQTFVHQPSSGTFFAPIAGARFQTRTERSRPIHNPIGRQAGGTPAQCRRGLRIRLRRPALRNRDRDHRPAPRAAPS